MAKLATNVTVKNISKKKQRVLAERGASKIDVAPGKDFETDLENAKDLARMYPTTFKIMSANVDGAPAVTGATPEEVEAEKAAVAHGIYDTLKEAILPAVMAEIADDEQAQQLLDGVNECIAAYLDDEHPAFALTIEQDHVVTADDLKTDPELEKEGVKVGETIQLPKPAFPRPEAAETVSGDEPTDPEKKDGEK